MQFAAATVIALTDDQIPKMTSFGILLFFNLSAVFFALLLCCKRKDLNRPGVQDRIGSLYLGLKTDKCSTLIQPMIYVLRRSLFVACSFFLLDYPSLQVQALITLGLCYIMYLSHAVVYEDPGTKRFEMYNEIFLLACCYVFMLFTNSGQLDPEVRPYLGIALLAVIVLLLLYNFTIIVRSNVQKVCRNRYLKQLKKRQTLVLNERRLAMETLTSASILNDLVNFEPKNQRL